MTDASTEHPRASRPRLPRAALRVWAWVAGALAFFLPLGGLAAQPAATDRPSEPRRVVVVRRVVVHESRPAPQPRVVYVAAPTASGGAVATTGGS